MRRRLRLALGACLLACAGGFALAQGLHRATVVVAGEQRLGPVEGHLLMLGGSATVDADARVNGSMVLLGEALTLDGVVTGDVFLLDGRLVLGPNARVEGRLVAGAGEWTVAPGATVVGGIQRDLAVAGELLRPTPTWTERTVRALVQGAVLALVAYLLARAVPGPLRRIGEAVAGHPAVAVSMGALAGLVGLVLLVAMAFTVVLIPVTLAGILLLAGAVGYGWIACGGLTGRWLARRGWAPRATPATTVVGTLAFVAALNGVALVPWIGSLVALLVSVTALGAVVLTAFGARRFVPDMASDSPTP